MRLPFDHFDLVARSYDRMAGTTHTGTLLELLDARTGQVVLDVGGGTGRNTASLASTGSRVIVCDASRGMIAQASAKGLAAVRGSVVRLPFPDASADRAVVVDAFHHFVHPHPTIAQPAAAAELVRVLKPGGRLVVEEPDSTQRAVRTVIWVERLLLMGSKFLAPDELIRLFTGLGCRLADQERNEFSVWLVFERLRDGRVFGSPRTGTPQAPTG